ncbi:type II secretion system F family protein [Oceanivirga miroungae]|uniref:Still frameshift type 4 fimbrial biogenesis protein PilC n=1 Tax=Oceanivirga miroungae TaxID=1130046 RepID=A0A6I8MB67_9FUSO|nr:type II secretion system F family protein [Oceanivirga miroungae]VWL85454.1 still frameshift type 4 fimbrial biogenesis protein PilC [Oceanivirga miroungae]
MLDDFKLRYEFVIRLYSLINEDIELIKALELISNINKRKVNKARLMLEKGYSIEKSFSYISKNKEFLSFFETAERTGDLKNALMILKEKYEFTKEFKSKIISLTIYPIIVVIISIIIINILLILVVPKFTDIYKDTNAKLPNMTKLIIFLSDNVFNIFIIFTLFLIIISISIVFLISKYPSFFDEIILKIKIVNLIQMTRLSKNISMLLNSNLSLVEALEISMPSNIFLKNKLRLVVRGIKKGESIYYSFKKAHIFDELFLTYIKISENTGNIKKAFLNISSIYEYETKNMINLYLKLFEPILIIIVAIFIGGITIAIMIPLLDISSFVMIDK